MGLITGRLWNGIGHSGRLISNGSGGYTYYSKNGPFSPSNSKESFSSEQEFYSFSSNRYDRSLTYKTNASQDAAMRNYADQNLDTFYNLCYNNCADLLDGIMKAGGIPVESIPPGGVAIPDQQFMYFYNELIDNQDC